MKRQLGHLLGEHIHQPVKVVKTNREISFQSLTQGPSCNCWWCFLLWFFLLVLVGKLFSQKQRRKSCEGFILVRNVGDICLPHSPPHCKYQSAPHFPPLLLAFSESAYPSPFIIVLSSIFFSSRLPFSGGGFTALNSLHFKATKAWLVPRVLSLICFLFSRAGAYFMLNTPHLKVASGLVKLTRIILELIFKRLNSRLMFHLLHSITISKCCRWCRPCFWGNS